MKMYVMKYSRKILMCTLLGAAVISTAGTVSAAEPAKTGEMPMKCCAMMQDGGNMQHGEAGMNQHAAKGMDKAGMMSQSGDSNMCQEMMSKMHQQPAGQGDAAVEDNKSQHGHQH